MSKTVNGFVCLVIILCFSEVYDVEEILDEKTIKKKKYVLIKWKGYPNPTWEPVDNVVSPPQV